jgi:hypothetical protein
MAPTTRTTGPLHFEDLDPKRFEDLVRQLAYDFRVWRRLEATGRAGSDDGFDARGLEIVADSSAVNDAEPDGADAEVPSGAETDRLWLIQCKREKVIGPTKLADYLEEIKLGDGEVLYGVIFAAACDFSKKAHDAFNAKCRALGVQECFLWGKAAIEDILFQPKNDPLLFAYFGFSLAIRQRSLQATLRRDIATKKRLKSVADRAPNKVFAIRNAAGDMYPKIPPVQRNFEADHWRLCPFGKLSLRGLVVEFSSFFAYQDGEMWDAADGPGLRRSHLYLGRWGHDAEDKSSYEAARIVWNGFEESKRAWLSVRGVIPYERILAIDEVGDEFFSGPHVLCQYVEARPLAFAYARVEPLDKFLGARLYVGDVNEGRVEKFPKGFRRPEANEKNDPGSGRE